MKINGKEIVMDKDIDKPWNYVGDVIEFVDYCLLNSLIKAPHKTEKGKLDDCEFMVRADVAAYACICCISHESIARELIRIGREFLDQTNTVDKFL